ncbi:MAG: flagellar hook-basal body complex protein FliE [Puniceicoccaceae bacterium]
MISGIESSSTLISSNQISQQMEQLRARQTQQLQRLEGSSGVDQATMIQPGSATEPSGRVTFGKLIGDLVQEVDGKGKSSAQELRRVMTGEVDNLHQSMVAMQEASVAFTLMVEVRNKLMESYQQIMRMQV